MRPRSIAVIGGGAWCQNVIKTCDTIGYSGAIWPVHPTKDTIAGYPAYPSIGALPAAPDASFIGVNRHASISCLSSLSRMGAGGAVCFASGFAEATAELADGANLQAELLLAAQDMTVLGPNCYGFLNYLDGAALWPDQQGGIRVERGVAIITQSSNIAINLTMQNRAVPLAYVVTAGNQAQTNLAEIGLALLRDPRVTCLGLHIEGISDIRLLEDLSNVSNELNKPICALKIGHSDQAQLATVSHTASLTGSHVGAGTLLARLGIAQTDDLATFLELLKIWHVAGPLRSNRIASASCSGGEASMMADLGMRAGLDFPDLSASQIEGLRAALGPAVALANPLDYHTYIWPNHQLMQQTFSALFAADLAMGLVVLDFPRADRCDLSDWEHALSAVIETARSSDVPLGLVASLPDTMPEKIALELLTHGVVPFSGMDHALAAISLAQTQSIDLKPILLPKSPVNTRVFSEDVAKQALAKFGLIIPASQKANNEAQLVEIAAGLSAPWVLKGLGVAHKSELGAVEIGLTTIVALTNVCRRMNCESYLLEEMVENPIIELLVSVLLDPVHGYVLTLGAGGTLTELLDDTATLLLPVSQTDVMKALASLRCAPVFDGYRGAQGVDYKAIWQAIEAIQNYVIAHHGLVQEVEINPLICTPDTAVAVDALIVQGDLE